MTLWRKIRKWILPRFLAPDEARDLDEEIGFYLAQETQLRIDRGESPAHARESARRDFGNRTLVSEITREMWGGHSMETLFQDLVYGFRQLRRNPGFTAAAVLTLALGIGANTALFSVVHSLLLRPLPVPHPDRIAVLAFRQKDAQLATQFSYPDYQDIRRQSSAVFADVIACQFGLIGLNARGQAGRMFVNYVTGNYFTTLGLKPALGRLIEPSEGIHPGADPVVVLSWTYWQSHFGADPGIVGSQAKVDGQREVTIIGVAPKGFHGLIPFLETQAYLPMSMAALDVNSGDYMHDRALRSCYVYSRLKPGVALEKANGELAVIGSRLAAQDPKDDSGIAISAFLERNARPDPASASVTMMAAILFLALTGLVLLLACINVANILLVRASARTREMAVRTALGAGRVRLIRQLLTESLLLALFGGAGGVLIGLWASRALSSIDLASVAVPLLIDIRFDWSVFAFALAAAVIAGTIVGAVPAVRASRADVAGVLHGSGRGIVAGRNRLRSVLVAVQVSGSLMLLIIAALFARSLYNAQRADLGFDPHHVANVTYDAQEAGYSAAQGRAFAGRLLARIRSMPGVTSASIAFAIPMGYWSSSSTLRVPGYQPPNGQTAPMAAYNVVTPGYFGTMRIPLLRGRDFAATDQPDTPHVAIINQAMAQRFWPHRDPIGREFTMFDDVKHPLHIIGIAKDSRIDNFSGPYPLEFYVGLDQNYVSIQTVQVRTAASPEALLPELQRIISGLAPGMPLSLGQTMTQAVQTLNGTLRYRISAMFAAALGTLGLLLAMIGLYGVISYSTAQRTHEIGLRMALGANPWSVLAMVLRQGMVMISAGLALGLVAAGVLARAVSAFLVNVSPLDPVTYASVTGLLVAVALAACYIPGRRATKIDPMAALRID